MFHTLDHFAELSFFFFFSSLSTLERRWAGGHNMKVVSNKCDVLAFQTEAKVNTKGCFVGVWHWSRLVLFCCSKCFILFLVIVVGQQSAQYAQIWSRCCLVIGVQLLFFCLACGVNISAGKAARWLTVSVGIQKLSFIFVFLSFYLCFLPFFFPFHTVFSLPHLFYVHSLVLFLLFSSPFFIPLLLILFLLFVSYFLQ